VDGANYQGSNQSVTTKYLQAKMEIWSTVKREKDTGKLFKQITGSGKGEYIFLTQDMPASTSMEKNGDCQFLINLLPFLGDTAPSRKITAYN
jgi:hypothetical protein